MESQVLWPFGKPLHKKTLKFHPQLNFQKRRNGEVLG